MLGSNSILFYAPAHLEMACELVPGRTVFPAAVGQALHLAAVAAATQWQLIKEVNVVGRDCRK
jgi:hypothetical protein